MGLDIYVRWDGMTEDEKKTQYTGFRPSPGAGYMRYSYSGANWFDVYGKEHNYPQPITEAFGGWSDNSKAIALEELTIAMTYRTRLQAWLDDNPEVKDVADEDYESYREEIEAWIEFIDFVNNHKDKQNLIVLWI